MIVKKFFTEALKLLGTSSKSDHIQRSKAHDRLASFAYEQYRNGLASGEAERLTKSIARRNGELRANAATSSRGLSRNDAWLLSKYRREAESYLEQDEEALQRFNTEQASFLEQAMLMILTATATSDLFDTKLIRFTSLWFEHAANETVMSKVESKIEKVPSHKFVFLTHQIAARINKVSGATAESKALRLFHKTVNSTMERMCKDHPFQTLYALYALRSDNESAASDSLPSKNTRNQRSAPPPSSLRSQEADSIWDKIKSRKERAEEMHDFDLACLAYVEWATLDVKTWEGGKFFSGGKIKKGPLKLPSSLQLGQLKDLKAPVATAEVPIDKTCRYNDYVRLVRYADVFDTAGGLHLPKISACYGSDGQKYKQLFKNKDDLRQDAVMQQVFRLVNELLVKDLRAKQRKLRIRTYLVRPLGEQWGLLQFVKDTVPLGDVMLDTHDRHPSAKAPWEVRNALHAASKTSRETRLQAFRQACADLLPQFRHYFFDTFADPQAWFSARLTYTRSVATTSIVGHMMGLGDRHVSNILMDTALGELVHIDFGVAFDQGKLLPIRRTFLSGCRAIWSMAWACRASTARSEAAATRRCACCARGRS